MKSDTAQKLNIGVMTLVAIVLFVAMVFAISKFNLIPQREIKIEFSFINSLEPGAPVRFAGARVGEIKRIELLTPEDRALYPKDPPYVHVFASVNKNVAIPKKTKALVTTMGFMGEKYLELMPESKSTDYLEDNGVLQGEDPIPMDTVFASAKKSLDDMQVAAGKIIGITTEMEDRLPVLIGELEKTLSSAQQLGVDAKKLTHDVHDMVRTNREDFDHMISNARQITIYMKSLSHVLAQRPWKLMWGFGGPIPIEPEQIKFIDPPEAVPAESVEKEKKRK
jgi:phospholipid/cholesterol/gamma-HCH transport system substrate-binding protein